MKLARTTGRSGSTRGTGAYKRASCGSGSFWASRGPMLETAATAPTGWDASRWFAKTCKPESCCAMIGAFTCAPVVRVFRPFAAFTSPAWPASHAPAACSRPVLIPVALETCPAHREFPGLGARSIRCAKYLQIRASSVPGAVLRKIARLFGSRPPQPSRTAEIDTRERAPATPDGPHNARGVPATRHLVPAVTGVDRFRLVLENHR